MKKTIAVFLACLMLFASVPFMAVAADGTWADTGVITEDRTVAAGDTLTITGTYTVTGNFYVEPGANLVISNNGSLIITGTGRLVNSGNVTVKITGTLNLSGTGTGTDGATLVNNSTGTIEIQKGSNCNLGFSSAAYNSGTIKNIDYLAINGKLYHQVTVPASFTNTYTKAEMWNRTETTVTYTVGYALDADFDTDLDYLTDDSYTNCSIDTNVWVQHGEKIYILISPEDGDGDWVDTSRMQLTIGGQLAAATSKIDNDRGVFCIRPTSALDVDVYSTSYKDVVKLFEIVLPRTEGYYVTTMDGDVDTCTVEFGKTLSFRVVLAPDYDKSEFYVYVNTAYMEPDEYGYFDVTGPIVDDQIATSGGVQGDITITVMGVSANEIRETMGSVLTFVQQIFDIIKSIFDYFADIFSGLFGDVDLGI